MTVANFVSDVVYIFIINSESEVNKDLETARNLYVEILWLN